MRRQIARVVVALLIGVIGLGAGPGAYAAARDTAPLQFFADGSRAGGQSLLTRDAATGSVSAKINTTHLQRGAAYSYWWVVFNEPALCSGGECGEDDLFNTDGTPNIAQINAVGISVLGGNGEIANNGGRATFTGRLFEGSALAHDLVIGPGGMVDAGRLLDPGNAAHAEIHIVIRNHGPALSGAALAMQLLTFAGNCAGLDPDGTFECTDEQFAVHR
jgi:hypothetical protein